MHDTLANPMWASLTSTHAGFAQTHQFRIGVGLDGAAVLALFPVLAARPQCCVEPLGP